MRRGRQAATARGQRRIVADIDHAHLHAAIGVTRKRFGNQLVVLLLHMKRGILHAQRLENALAQKSLQRLTRNDLDHPPQHVGGTAVLKRAARLEDQRQASQLPGEFGQTALARTNAQLGVLALHRGAAQKLIGHASGVAQQVMQGGGAPNRLQLHRAIHQRQPPAGPRIPANSRATGSFSNSLPSSISIMAATETIGLVME